MVGFRVCICRNFGPPWLGSGCVSTGILDPRGWVWGEHLQEFWTPMAGSEVCICSMKLECLGTLSGLLGLLFPLWKNDSEVSSSHIMVVLATLRTGPSIPPQITTNYQLLSCTAPKAAWIDHPCNLFPFFFIKNWKTFQAQTLLLSTVLAVLMFYT